MEHKTSAPCYGPMLGQRRRRWTGICLTLIHCLVCLVCRSSYIIRCRLLSLSSVHVVRLCTHSCTLVYIGVRHCTTMLYLKVMYTVVLHWCTVVYTIVTQFTEMYHNCTASILTQWYTVVYSSVLQCTVVYNSVHWSIFQGSFCEALVLLASFWLDKQDLWLMFKMNCFS